MSFNPSPARLAVLMAVLITGLAWIPAANAQTELKERIAAAMELIGDGAREVLEEEMIMTDEQAAKFWPLYDEYAAEKRKLGERYVPIVESAVKYVEAANKNSQENVTAESGGDLQRQESHQSGEQS